MFFFNTVTAQDWLTIQIFTTIYCKTLPFAIESYDAVRQIISLLIPKGLNLNTIVGGRDAATIFFVLEDNRCLKQLRLFGLQKINNFYYSLSLMALILPHCKFHHCHLMPTADP